MRLQRLMVEQYCQYDMFTCVFTPGVNLITGANGSGKSNLAKAIYAAVTGDYRRNAGVKNNNIRHGRPRGFASRIWLELSHRDVTLDVTRGLDPHEHILHVTTMGVPTVKTSGGTQVTTELLGILGVTSQMLSDYVFIDQWAVFSFLTMQPAVRAGLLQRLFGTATADVIYQQLGTELNSLPCVESALSRQIVDEQLKTIRQRIYVAEQALAALPEDVLANYDSTNDPLQQVLRDWDRLLSQRMLIAELEVDCTAAREQYNRANEIYTEVNKIADELSARLDALTEPYRAATQLIDQWDDNQLSKRWRERAEAKVIALSNSIDVLSVPTPVPSGLIEDVDAAHQQRVELAERIREATSYFVRIPAPDGDEMRCPTCDAPAPQLLEKAKEYARNLPGWREQWVELGKRIDETFTYHGKDAERQSHLTRELYLLEQQMIQLDSTPAVPDMSEEAYQVAQAQFAAYSELGIVYSNQMRAVQSASQERAAAQGRLEALTTKLERAKNVVIPHVEADDVHRARGLLASRNVAAMSRRIHEEARYTALVDEEQLLEQLELVRAAEQQAAALSSWRAHGQALRNLFHHSALPYRVSQSHLQRLGDGVNALLQRFDADFRVTVGDDLSFVAEFHRGKKAGAIQPAERLSGGEKVLLAIAFRVAVNSQFASDLGLLVLDEPTAGLDANNISCLGVAFEALRELSASSGLQVVMITHEERLPAADNYIHVPSTVHSVPEDTLVD